MSGYVHVCTLILFGKLILVGTIKKKKIVIFQHECPDTHNTHMPPEDGNSTELLSYSYYIKLSLSDWQATHSLMHTVAKYKGKEAKKQTTRSNS